MKGMSPGSRANSVTYEEVRISDINDQSPHVDEIVGTLIDLGSLSTLVFGSSS